MKTSLAVRALAALAQESRLAAFRMLVRKGPAGTYPAELATRLKVAPPTLSFHLKELANAGLVQARPEGRRIRYSADFRAMGELVAYLTENCCEGQACAARPAEAVAA
jgi:DNA-binding transcriptional ArsR family regulator